MMFSCSIDVYKRQDVDHVLERHGALLLLDIAIDQLAVEDGLHSLVDFEDELRLVRVIHRNGGPRYELCLLSVRQAMIED